MGRILRSCMQSMLKMVNSVGGFVGVAFILYGLWMMRVWYRNFHSDPTLPWFIYTSLGVGVSLCLITCFGHIAAETSNGHCISFYMVLIFLIVMVEAAITADVILNKDWEEDFPDDTTWRFNELKNFIRSNFELCQWVGLTIVTAQGMSIFLAMILKALGPNSGTSYDSDDDSAHARLPLVQGATYVCDPPTNIIYSKRLNKYSEERGGDRRLLLLQLQLLAVEGLCSGVMDQPMADSYCSTALECRNGSSSNCEVKSCGVCRTTEMPLWRSGPKTLCNACGIRYPKNKMEPVMKAKKEKKEWFLEVQMLGLGLRKKRSINPIKFLC